MPKIKPTPPSEADLAQTVKELVALNHISAQQGKHLYHCAIAQLASSSYVLKHLGAHLSIGVIFAFDVIPIPLGTIARVVWVAGARIRETLKSNWERARVHSLGVLAVAAIPWFGYAAYLLPLRRDSKELAYLLANYSWSLRTGRNFEAFIASRSKRVAQFSRWLVPTPTYQSPQAEERH